LIGLIEIAFTGAETTFSATIGAIGAVFFATTGFGFVAEAMGLAGGGEQVPSVY